MSDTHASLNTTAERILPANSTAVCKKAAVAWATILMAHRVVYCPDMERCRYKTDDPARGFLWDTERKWEVNHDWYTKGLSLALAYDVLYNDMNDGERRTVRSALSLLVMNRWTWGTSDISDRNSPNALIHPHRIYGNWALYHSNLFLTNLALEGETDIVPYASQVLKASNATIPFNQNFHDRFTAMISAFMIHSFNPDGSTFEDGYSYHTAFREGSLALVATHIRGTNLLHTPRFRNLIHNAAQMTEPWFCSPLLGHASGGGEINYNAYTALFRYAYPDGPLSGMLWKQRTGEDFDNRKCRVYWTQTMTQLTFLGGDHASADVATTPATLSVEDKSNFPLAYVSTRRGLIITRSSYSNESSYMHFDPRPDSFLLGHDNADRGLITFSALGRRWLDDLDWKRNFDSRRHSLMHIDGLAQAIKAPSVTIMKVDNDESGCIAAADLTYAYNVVWARSWQGPNSGSSAIKEYDANGKSRMAPYFFTEPEENSPWDLGWPMEDDGHEIGFNRSMTLNGYPNLLFGGLHQWKRNYRERILSHMVRSTIMVRSNKNDVGFGVLVDCAGSDDDGSHVFESYLILRKGLLVDSFSSKCNANSCKVVLRTEEIEQLDVHVRTIGTRLSFRMEEFDGHKRLIFKTVGLSKEEFWIAFHPHRGNPNGFSMLRSTQGHVKFTYEGDSRFFEIDRTDFTVIETNSAGVRKIPKPETKPKQSGVVDDEPSKTDEGENKIGSSGEMDDVELSPQPFSEAADIEISPGPSSEFDEIYSSPEPSAGPEDEEFINGRFNGFEEQEEMKKPCDESHETELTSEPSLDGSNEWIDPSSSSSNKTGEGDDLVQTELETKPMRPINIDFRSWKKVELGPKYSNNNTFFHQIKADWQVIFNFKSIQNGQRLDTLSTCRGYTNVETKIAVYDCGTGPHRYLKYENRDCFLVEESDEQSFCSAPMGQNKTEFTLMLLTGRNYYAVVSAFGQVERPRLMIGHKLVWAGLL